MTTPDSTTQLFTSKQVCAYAGISSRQLQWWCEHEYIKTIEIDRRRLFSAEEMERASIIARFRRKGLQLNIIVRLRFKPGFAYYVTDGKEVIAASDYTALVDWQLARRGPFYVVSTAAKPKVKGASVK